MEQSMDCPACGAPVLVPQGQKTIRCDFCGTELQVGEASQDLVQVVSKPEPQAGVLRERAEEELFRATFEDKPVEAPISPDLDAAGPEANDLFGQITDPVFHEAPVAAPVPQSSVPYPAAGSAKPGNRRWIFIALVAILAACLLIACLAVTVMLIAQRG